MKKIILSIAALSALLSCSDDNNDTLQKEEQENQEQNDQLLSEEGEELFPLVNVAGIDSVDANGNIVYGTADQFDYGVNDEVVPQLDSASGREYTLGPRPATPLPNIYGEDSIGPDGDYLYPPRDTNWIEHKNQ